MADAAMLDDESLTRLVAGRDHSVSADCDPQAGGLDGLNARARMNPGLD